MSCVDVFPDENVLLVLIIGDSNEYPQHALLWKNPGEILALLLKR